MLAREGVKVSSYLLLTGAEVMAGASTVIIFTTMDVDGEDEGVARP